jgi:biopolymer transport protein ExbB
MKSFKATKQLILTLALLLLATVFPALAAEGEGAPEEAPQTIIEIVMHGGPLIISIWLAILGTSVVMVTFVIQNFLTLQKGKLAPPALVDALKNLLEAGNYQEAWETCNANNNYLSNVIQTALSRIGRGKEAVGDAVAEAALREAQMVRNRNSYLSVIGVVSPMIGLLGTVIGMMGAFATLGSSGIANPRALATSIGEVLMATASGLFIAIPAFIFYYFFRNRSQVCIVHADDFVNSLLVDIPFDELQGIKIGEGFSAPAGAPSPAPGAPRPAAAQSRRVSAALTTNCPVCNGAITAGQTPCPHCGATLDWAQ